MGQNGGNRNDQAIYLMVKSAKLKYINFLATASS